VEGVSANRLGTCLRARRDLVDPQHVGLPGGGRRRVPGLRREEVALLAGLRALIGPDDGDPRIVELVNELSTGSETFRRLWARHDVSPGGADT
jgi:hypothetical protein